MDWLIDEIGHLNKHENNMSFDRFVNETDNLPFDVLNLSNFQILLTGKTEEESKVGWVLRFIGCSSSNIFDGEIALKVEQNLFPDSPSKAPVGSVFKTLTLTHFRRAAFPILDTMNFETTSFIILSENRRIARLGRILPFLTLPTIDTSDIPFFESELLMVEKKKRSYKKTYRSGKRKVLKPVQKKVDKLILSYQKSICDVERTIKTLKKDLDYILDTRLEALRSAKRRQERFEQKEPEVIDLTNDNNEIRFEDIAHLLPENFFFEQKTEILSTVTTTSTLYSSNSPPLDTSLQLQDSPPEFFF